VFEKSGTFVNQQFRLQKFAAAVPGPAGATDDLACSRSSSRRRRRRSADLAALWPALAAEVPALGHDVTYAKSPRHRPAARRTPWAALPFAEGETLHFKPPPDHAPLAIQHGLILASPST
jgi:NADH-quinone oxidoreductase subunit G